VRRAFKARVISCTVGHGKKDKSIQSSYKVSRAYRGFSWLYQFLGTPQGIALGLALIISFVSLPAFSAWPWCTGEQDLIYHLARIEGIKEGLLSGQFPVKIEPPQLNGAGYANGVFYPDLFLYFPAFLALAGLSVGSTWNIMLVAINVACCLLSYGSFKRMFGSKRLGLLGSLLYTAGFYRLMDVYLRSTVGEHLALVFLPLVALGMWRLYAPDVSEDSRRRAWLPLAAGFVGIAQSHLLSIEMTGLFCLFVMLFFWRKTFTKGVLVCWLKVAVLVVLLDLYFLVPLLDYLQGSFSITDPSRKTWWIGGDGVNPVELITLIPTNSSSLSIFSFGFQTDMPIGLGYALVIGGFVGLTVLFREKKDVAGEPWVVALILGLLAAFMSTCAFPWNFLQRSLGSYASLVANIQFPWRFLGIASLLLVIASCGVLLHLAKTGRLRSAKLIAVAMGGLTCLVAAVFMALQVKSSVPFSDEDLSYYMGTSAYGVIGNGEYLPGEVNEANKSAIVNLKTWSSVGVEIERVDKSYLNMSVEVDNTIDQEGFISLPLLWYKGYVATDALTGEALQTTSAGAAGNFAVRVIIPADYAGTIQVRFVEPWYWRVAEWISLSAVMLLVMRGTRHRHIHRKRKGDSG